MKNEKINPDWVREFKFSIDGKVISTGDTPQGTFMRTFTLVPPESKEKKKLLKPSGSNNPDYGAERYRLHEERNLQSMAGRLVHNLVDLAVSHYDREKNELQVFLETSDISYDLTALYQELSGKRYILR